MKKNAKKILLSLLLVLGNVYYIAAQCAMCGAANESNLKEGTGEGFKNINAGILFLMVMPYIAFIILVYLWYKHSYKHTQERQRVEELVGKAISHKE